MGLVLTSESYRGETPGWSYSGFNRYRALLADALDWPEAAKYLRTLGASGGFATLEEKQEAMIELIAHSDCDGEISPRHLRRMRPILRELEDKPPLADSSDNLIEHRRLLKLIDYCLEQNEAVIFC